MPPTRRHGPCRRLAALIALAVIAACESDHHTRIEITGWKAGVTREQYEAIPDSVRLGTESNDSRGEVQGATVDVLVILDGYQGQAVPLDYTLHDARNGLPFVSRRMPLAPDSPKWTRRGRLWLPVPAAGTYYVQVVLGDSTGREAEGPRTEDFTIQ